MLKLTLKDNTYSGKLIVFEGTDGAGKTTMIGLTQQLLEEKYGKDNILSVKQPTDMSRKTKLFQKMMYSKNHEDIDYRAVQLLTMSDRVQHSFETIIPALKEGKIVICDRYIFTSLATRILKRIPILNIVCWAITLKRILLLKKNQRIIDIFSH